jgi:hypothetical protein
MLVTIQPPQFVRLTWYYINPQASKVSDHNHCPERKLWISKNYKSSLHEPVISKCWYCVGSYSGFKVRIHLHTFFALKMKLWEPQVTSHFSAISKGKQKEQMDVCIYIHTHMYPHTNTSFTYCMCITTSVSLNTFIRFGAQLKVYIYTPLTSM